MYPSANGKLLSLFCGPGGLDLGFKQAGFSVELAYDKDRACVETYRFNNPTTTVLRQDLSKIRIKEIIQDWDSVSTTPPTGIIGGPPCQSFSIGNVHQTDDDPRHALPTHYARILAGITKAYDIDFFAFENVPGLLKQAHSERLKRFKAHFRRAGFVIFESILDAKYFGVPQSRPRVFIVGLNRKKYAGMSFEYPQQMNTAIRNVKDALHDLPEATFFERGLSVADVRYHPNHWCMYPKSPKFTNGSLVEGQSSGRSFKVLSWDKPSYTVAYGNREVHVHPQGHRRLSVFEAMLLQGFPDSYVLQGTLTDQIRLVSEAVSPPVAKALACSIASQLAVHREAILPSFVVPQGSLQ